MVKSAGKLIGFVVAYTAVAYLVLAILAAVTDSDIAAGPMLLAALFVAMVTVLFDEKGTVPSPARTAVVVLLVPVVAAWAFFGYQALNSDFPEPGYIWQPLLCIALFVTPTLLGRRLRKGWKRRR